MERPDVSFRFARREDVGLVLDFIRCLSVYEKRPEQVVASEAMLEKALFDRRQAEALFVLEDGKEVGFAVFFYTFSTFRGHAAIHLEDLFILPEYRGRGLGRAAMAYLCALVKERDCARLEWSCLKWNEPAIRFYKSMDAELVDEWDTYQLEGPPLERMAEEN